MRQRTGDMSEFLVPNGQNLAQPVACVGSGNPTFVTAGSCVGSGRTPAVLIPRGFPGAGTPAAGGNLAPYMTNTGRVLAGLYPAPNYVDPNNRYNYVLSVLEPTNRLEMKYRFDWNVTNNTKAYVRLALDSEDVEGARGVWWGASEVALPSPNLGTNKGRSISGNVVTVLSPTMTNEAVVTFSRLQLDNTYADPSVMLQATHGISVNGSLTESPYIPGMIPNWGGGVSNMWSAANDMYAHNDALLFSDKLTKIAGAHGLKFGVSLERLQKQQNFQNDEEGRFVYAPAWGTPGSTGNAVGDILAGRPTQYLEGTGSPDGEYRFWNFDFFAQDSWKLRSNLTFEYGVRGGYWTNNRELNSLGGIFDPTVYDPTKPQFLDPGTFQTLNGVRYVDRGQAPDGILDNRSPFVMPRANLAWDIDGQGSNVLRGGYGLFYNRNMGNVEYDNTLRLPPYIYTLNVSGDEGTNYGGGRGLTYDTVGEATLQNRLGSLAINTLTDESFKFPTTHSYSVSYARRIFFNQVAEVAYVGTRGRNLVSRVELNAVPNGRAAPGHRRQRQPLQSRCIAWR